MAPSRPASRRPVPVRPPPRLRAYQREDVDAIKAAEGRALVTSTPGTGKTPIAVRALRELGRTRMLVVAPASVIRNWRRELRAWAPDLRVHILDGIPRTTRLLRAHVYVIGWTLLDEWAPRLARAGLRSIVLDEVHLVRHPDTLRSAAARKLCADVPVLIGLTGTPVVTEAEDLEVIRALWGDRPPIVIRRLLEEVAPDVPPKTRSTLYVRLRPADQQRYDRAHQDFEAFLRELGKKPSEVRRSLRAEVFTRIGYLRRILEAGKAWAAADWACRAALVGEPVVLFCDGLQTLRRLRRLLRIQRIRSLVIEGSTPSKRRDAIVQAFQRHRVPVLLCTRAGIEGITLTAARQCLFVGRFWCSTEEDQAEDRIHRIGQTQPSIAFRLHAAGTLDDRLAEIVDDRRALVRGSLRTVPISESDTAEAIVSAWGAHVGVRKPVSDLGTGAFPPALPDPRQVRVLEFSRTRWTPASARAWCRMHGYPVLRCEEGVRSFRWVVHGGAGATFAISRDIRALVGAER